MKTVVVTGASRGIGKALAQKFLENGYFVIGTSTSGNANVEHDNFKIFRLDLSGPQSIKDCAERIRAFNNKKIDILVNNAGMCVEEEDSSPTIVPEYLRRTLEVNLIGVIDFTERLIPLMNAGGHIINISSRAGSLGHEDYTLNYPAYRISKAALNMATRVWANRLKDAIRVSSVHPGWVKTDMGGEEAEISPTEAAEDIYKLAVSDVPTGQFWFKQEKFPW